MESGFQYVPAAPPNAHAGLTARWRLRIRSRRLPVVDELQGEVEFLAFQQADHRLQVVLFLRRDAKLLALDLSPDAFGPLVPDDLGDLLGVVLGDALLEGRRSIRYSLPEGFGSPESRVLSETPRLTSLSLKTSRTALARSSLLARMSTAYSPDHAIEAPTPRKSNRVPISLAAWLTALSTSWWLSLDTMSKEDSCAATGSKARRDPARAVTPNAP